MATPNVGILTTAGKALIDRVNAGQTKITFSKVVFSSMDNSQLSDIQVKALTAISPQEVVVSPPETTLDTTSGETRIRATGANKQLADGVYVKTYGVFAKDDTGNEILYGVTVSPNPNYFPAYDGVTPQAVTYSYKTVIQETSNITMTNSNDVYASQEDLTESLTESLQPYAKTVDVNQQLDKKVNVADMRKPASDVAGIEEVNAKADDSKVVHDNKDNTIQVNGTQVSPYNKLSDTIGGRNLLINTAQLNDNSVCLDAKSNISDTYLGLNIYQSASAWSGVKIFWSYIAPKIQTGVTYIMSEYVRNTSPTTSVSIGLYGSEGGVVFNSKTGPFTTIPANSGWTRISIPVNIASLPSSFTSTNKIRFENSTALSDGYVQFAGLDFRQASIPKSDWTPAPEDKVNVADMRKPANDVAGIEEVNAKQDKLTITPADDSKVAHLSGANNFDTVPTVNNNPLLLASSLPSDLARTGQDQEFTGKNTFDVAPIDKITGNPYITKDGVPAVPSTLADTTKDTNFTGKLQKSGIDVATTTDVTNAVSTATANMADTTKPANFTAGLQSGGLDVATAADLKSVEDASWRPLTLKHASSGTILFKDNGDGTGSLTGTAVFTIGETLTPCITPPNGYTFTSLKWIVDRIIAIFGSYDSGYSTLCIYASLSNGDICFSAHGNTTVFFSPSEFTTLENGTKGNPALVSISKV